MIVTVRWERLFLVVLVKALSYGYIYSLWNFGERVFLPTRRLQLRIVLFDRV